MSNTWISGKVKVSVSKIESRGIFAITKIYKGEIVAVAGGKIMNDRQLRDLDARLANRYPVQISESLYIGPTSFEELYGLDFLNHSCEPNLGVWGSIIFVAMRNIDAGEELTYDYCMTDSTDEPPHSYPMKCKCGRKMCRGDVDIDDWKKPELQERYKGYFSLYIEEKIRNGQER